MRLLNQLLLCLLLLLGIVFISTVLYLSINDPILEQAPLSDFRYGHSRYFGVLLFFILLSIGGIYIYFSRKFGSIHTQCVAYSSEFLLIVILGTPSYTFIHDLAANFLMAMIYIYFFFRILHSGSVWVITHAIIPICIILALINMSLLNLGMLQKSFIIYLVIIVIIDCCLLSDVLSLFFADEEKKERVRVQIRTPVLMRRKFS